MRINLYYNVDNEENILIIPFKSINKDDFEYIMKFFEEKYSGDIKEINTGKNLINSFTKPVLIITSILILGFDLLTGLLILGFLDVL